MRAGWRGWLAASEAAREAAPLCAVSRTAECKVRDELNLIVADAARRPIGDADLTNAVHFLHSSVMAKAHCRPLLWGKKGATSPLVQAICRTGVLHLDAVNIGSIVWSMMRCRMHCDSVRDKVVEVLCSPDWMVVNRAVFVPKRVALVSYSLTGLRCGPSPALAQALCKALNFHMADEARAHEDGIALGVVSSCVRSISELRFIDRTLSKGLCTIIVTNNSLLPKQRLTNFPRAAIDIAYPLVKPHLCSFWREARSSRTYVPHLCYLTAAPLPLSVQVPSYISEALQRGLPAATVFLEQDKFRLCTDLMRALDCSARWTPYVLVWRDVVDLLLAYKFAGGWVDGGEQFLYQVVYSTLIVGCEKMAAEQAGAGAGDAVVFTFRDAIDVVWSFVIAFEELTGEGPEEAARRGGGAALLFRAEYKSLLAHLLRAFRAEYGGGGDGGGGDRVRERTPLTGTHAVRLVAVLVFYRNTAQLDGVDRSPDAARAARVVLETVRTSPAVWEDESEELLALWDLVAELNAAERVQAEVAAGDRVSAVGGRAAGTGLGHFGLQVRPAEQVTLAPLSVRLSPRVAARFSWGYALRVVEKVLQTPVAERQAAGDAVLAVLLRRIRHQAPCADERVRRVACGACDEVARRVRRRAEQGKEEGEEEGGGGGGGGGNDKGLLLALAQEVSVLSGAVLRAADEAGGVPPLVRKGLVLYAAVVCPALVGAAPGGAVVSEEAKVGGPHAAVEEAAEACFAMCVGGDGKLSAASVHEVVGAACTLLRLEQDVRVKARVEATVDAVAAALLMNLEAGNAEVSSFDVVGRMLSEVEEERLLTPSCATIVRRCAALLDRPRL